MNMKYEYAGICCGYICCLIDHVFGKNKRCCSCCSYYTLSGAFESPDLLFYQPTY